MEKISKFLCRIRHKWYYSLDCKKRWCRRGECGKKQKQVTKDIWIDD